MIDCPRYLSVFSGLFLLATVGVGQPMYIRGFAERILRSVSSEERPGMAELLSHGRLVEASAKLNEIAQRTSDTQSSGRLRDYAADLKLENPNRWFESDQINGSVIPLGQMLEMPDADWRLFRPVEAGSKRILSFVVRPVRVKQFVYRYSLGYRNPEGVFQLADSRMQRQIERAKSAGRDRVVTIISAGKDRELVLRRTEKLESDGYVVLSYLFCETPTGQFCSDVMIGAFAGISGHVMELNTANAQQSSFVFEEIDAVRRLMAGQELVTIISYEELAGAARQTAGSLATAAASVYLVESSQN
jgi:hypothetical protein